MGEQHDHTWVSVRFMPVYVEPNGENLEVSVDENAELLARDDEVICCWFCNEQLTTVTYQTQCKSQQFA